MLQFRLRSLLFLMVPVAIVINLAPARRLNPPSTNSCRGICGN